MREFRSYGSVRGAPGNRRSYRDSNKASEASLPQIARLLQRTLDAAARTHRNRFSAGSSNDRSFRPMVLSKRETIVCFLASDQLATKRGARTKFWQWLISLLESSYF